MAMELRGSLNVSKFQKNPSQPRFYGRALIGGVLYDIKGWEKETNGEPWIPLLFEGPGKPAQAAAPQKTSLFSNRPAPAEYLSGTQTGPRKVFDDMDDDIPF